MSTFLLSVLLCTIWLLAAMLAYYCLFEKSRLSKAYLVVVCLMVVFVFGGNVIGQRNDQIQRATVEKWAEQPAASYQWRQSASVHELIIVSLSGKE